MLNWLTLPEPYVAILVAWVDGQPAGCVAFKPLDLAWGEVKRLYVRPAFRGLGLAQQLMARASSITRGATPGHVPDHVSCDRSLSQAGLCPHPALQRQPGSESVIL